MMIMNNYPFVYFMASFHLSNPATFKDYDSAPQYKTESPDVWPQSMQSCTFSSSFQCKESRNSSNAHNADTEYFSQSVVSHLDELIYTVMKPTC